MRQLEETKVDNLIFLGVSYLDLDVFGYNGHTESTTNGDLKKVRKLREKARTRKFSDEERELKFMENCQRKAEIESLYCPDSKSFCEKYLIPKIRLFLGHDNDR